MEATLPQMKVVLHRQLNVASHTHPHLGSKFVAQLLPLDGDVNLAIASRAPNDTRRIPQRGVETADHRSFIRSIRFRRRFPRRLKLSLVDP